MNTSPRTTFRIIHHFEYIAEYLRLPSNEAENQRLIQLVRALKTIMEERKDPNVALLIDLVMEKIQAYEKSAYPIKPLKAHEMLAFLMEQHNLLQKDLPEIGSQSHVSKLLSGKRNLTHIQIDMLSKRFHISPAVFYK
jgi:HTH-type transcriptional regulator / antitoxin HigA